MIKKLHEERFIGLCVIILILIILFFCELMTIHEMKIRKIDITEIPVKSKEDGAFFSIDQNYYVNDIVEGLQIYIQGWAILKGSSTNSISIHVILKNNESGECNQLPTHIESRKDVTNFFGNNTNYDNSGFVSKLTTDFFDFQKNNYSILIHYQTLQNDFIIDTGFTLTEKE